MFTYRDVYPLATVLETTERTIPIEQERKDPFVKEDVEVVSPEERKNIWLGILVIFVLLCIFAGISFYIR